MSAESIKDILGGLFKDLQTPEKQARGKLLDGWEKIVGKKIAARTKPFLGRQEDLLIWTDEAALAFELRQRYKETILRRTEALIGKKIRNLKVFVGELRK